MTLRKPRGSSLKTRLTLAGLSLTSFALCLLIAEGASRIWYPTYYHRPPPDQDSWTVLLHRPSDVPGLSYELAAFGGSEPWAGAATFATWPLRRVARGPRWFGPSGTWEP